MFSVIIPLYNKAHTIKHTLDTVLAQTFTNFEVIIVNDGSTDNGVDVIESNFNDPRIKIIHQKNQGVSVARNRGINESINDFIAFLDADDEWLSYYLEKTKEAIQMFPNSGIYLSGRYFQDLNSNTRINTIPEKYKNKIQPICFFQNPHVFSHISATVIKRSFISSLSDIVRFIEGQKSNEDFTFLFRLAFHSKVIYSGFPCAIYNGGIIGQTTSSLDESKRIEDSILFHNKVISEWIKTSKRSADFIIFIKYELRHIFLRYLKTKNHNSINFYKNQLDPNYQKIFSRSEWFLYSVKGFRKVMILYILLTKLIWRLRKYPRIK